MAFPLDRTAIEAAFIEACHAELAALKPGNVHVHGAGHGMETAHFEAAAAAAAPFIGEPAQGVGTRILGAVEASFAATGLNTNLGIVLLAAPLAAAADTPTGGGDLRQRLVRVLDTLDRADADAAFKAIVIANPAGLGRVAASDVAEPAAITLKEAMALASERDRIARAYVTGFEDIFAKGLPTLEIARRAADSETLAVTALHMSFLATFEDSHIARKHGAEAAAAVQREARALEHLWRPAPRPGSWQSLLDLDASLKARGLNPGTTADLVVGTLFADGLVRRSV
ncbi:triphosphoribosyl-dephospho-CoA synthase [Hyphomicrobium sp.]|uniref:triphosphoribosyl-dephospho-CoA synthase n=1 Tax=Hyphomicrobium sp. TaxID=82 RepID=UPI002FDDE34D